MESISPPKLLPSARDHNNYTFSVSQSRWSLCQPVSTRYGQHSVRCERIAVCDSVLTGTPSTYLDADQRQALSDEIFEYQAEYISRWEASGIDALIMPVTLWVGLRPMAWVQSDMYIGYSALFNLLNWTALAVPWTIVEKTKDRPSEEWMGHESRSFSDRFNHDYYDIELFEGMPVGIQIVTGRFGEEKALGVAQVLRSLSN